MRASDKLYLILNNDETLYKNDRQEPMIYRKVEKFVNQERFTDCKVAVFELKEIISIKKLKSKK
ncbi:hypothetical protein [Candidatus Stoquefichus massiliensis]|uniref:hypothetical protein n=1 Tax=Candidatus Stoquefichus massiliensis TaxID=1470350 RepID=UPI00048373C4|nr:hypothetical protein [Candidatus Stoquefichus massiliensis]